MDEDLSDNAVYVSQRSHYAFPHDVKVENVEGLNILHWNINGLMGKIDGVNLFLANLKQKNIQIDAILFCETLINKDSQEPLPIIGDYVSEHYIRPTNGGGISIYVLPQYKYT